MSFVFTVDGQPVDARAGETLLTALRRHSCDSPTLCHADPLAPAGSCRLGGVEMKCRVADGFRMVASCEMATQAGMEIRTQSDALRQTRRALVTLLRRLAPDAPALQARLDRAVGVATSPENGVPTGEGPAPCIRCGLCVQVCGEVVGAHAIAMLGRGRSLRADTPPHPAGTVPCIACGACAALCPTGHAARFPAAGLDALKLRTAVPRPCRYALMGLAPDVACAANYQCAVCDIHHRMLRRAEDAGVAHPVFLKGTEKGTEVR